MIEVTKDTINSEVLDKEGLVVLELYSTTCEPCKMLMAELQKVNTDVPIAKVALDENPEVAGIFGVMKVPVLAFVKDGVVVEKLNGVHASADIEAKINQLK